MQLLEALLAIAIINYLRRTVNRNGEPYSGEMNRTFLAGIFIAVGLIVSSKAVSSIATLIDWITHVFLLYIVYQIFTNEKFKSAKPLVNAMLPIVAVAIISSVVKLLSPASYESWSSYFSTAKIFSFIWLAAMWFISRNQSKALEQERVIAIQKEKEYKVSEKLKSELEVQVAERTAALTKQKEALEETLTELKSTQAQLIQSEKMASLGELTAGIAHEIQNPLNFVNNFSEVSTELVDDLNEEIAKGNIGEVKAIANDLRQNLEKINHHGKRAGDIVKGMLQHSRSSSGLKEPTDINKLADEYLRLAYHGLRAKDKTFNASMTTDYDERIGNINIIPQDIGRVILNLITNAFYSVNAKAKEAKPNNTGAQYMPTVSVSTKLLNTKVEIKVADNGNGIPKQIMDKIFQPFFTTKPSGQGTGLGLSLSYDILKAHGGEIRAENRETGGAEFIIILPK